MKKINNQIKIVLSVVLIGVLFLLVSYFVGKTFNFWQGLIEEYYYLGIFIYILLAIISVVVAPLATVPLIPLASALWGPFLAALFSIIGWAFGSVIVFYIAKEYGKKYVSKFVSLEEIERVERALPEKNLFFGLIILRILIPADLLSYALGLFTKINYWMFIVTTIIGMIPLAFVFAYLGGIPLIYQAVILAGGSVVFLLMIRKIVKKVYG